MAARLRERLGTQELLELLGERINAHAAAETVRASARLTSVVMLLTVAATVMPVLLALATPEWRKVVHGPGWWAALALLVVLVGAVGFVGLSRRREVA
jgi:hypothetical protein